MTIAMAMSKTMTVDMHLTNINGIVIDITIIMFVIVMGHDTDNCDRKSNSKRVVAGNN